MIYMGYAHFTTHCCHLHVNQPRIWEYGRYHDGSDENSRSVSDKKYRLQGHWLAIIMKADLGFTCGG